MALNIRNPEAERLAAELARDNILVSGIAPGAFQSDMNTAARDHEAQ